MSARYGWTLSDEVSAEYGGEPVPGGHNEPDFCGTPGIVHPYLVQTTVNHTQSGAIRHSCVQLFHLIVKSVRYKPDTGVVNLYRVNLYRVIIVTNGLLLIWVW